VLLATLLLASCARGAAAPSTSTAGTATPTPEIAGQPIASTAATARAALPVAEFERTDGTLARLPIEVPPPAEYSIGLSGRRTLADERGMLFYYRQMGRGAFWMKDTHFDLAIAFMASNEQIVDIVEMRAEDTSIVTPRADYQYAIEAPAGWYKQQGIRIGDRARLAFPLPAYLTAG
jgi:hypothetical protein